MRLKKNPKNAVFTIFNGLLTKIDLHVQIWSASLQFIYFLIVFTKSLLIENCLVILVEKLGLDSSQQLPDLDFVSSRECSWGDTSPWPCSCGRPSLKCRTALTGSASRTGGARSSPGEGRDWKRKKIKQNFTEYSFSHFSWYISLSVWKSHYAQNGILFSLNKFYLIYYAWTQVFKKNFFSLKF